MKANSFTFSLVVIALACIFCACARSKDDTATAVPFFAKGADVGWVTEMEAAGLKFLDPAGKPGECMEILKGKGINSIRLRAWVNPANGWNNTKDVLVKAKRAQALGLKLMIDFHYSDSWADPGKQPKPKAWASLDIEGLKSALYAYTVGVMDTLKLNGITPDWVQVGNETNDGMDWEEGRASKSMANFAGLVSSGYKAVKSVSPTSQVIVHLSNGYDSAMFKWMFDGLKSNGATWDIIGMSLYPSYAPEGVWGWKTVNARCMNSMNFLVERYGTPVMIVEVGMPAANPTESKGFLSDIIARTKKIPNHMGLGVFYWEPECYKNWNGYALGAFDDNGKPTVAMDAFAE